MQNLSIKAKLVAAFSSLLLVILVLSGVAIERMGVMNDSATNIRVNWLPSVTVIGKVLSTVEYIRIVELRMVMNATTEDKIKEEFAIMDQYMKPAEEAVKTYLPMVTKGTDDEKFFGEFLGEWTEYKDHIKNLQSVIKSGDIEKARLLASTTGREKMAVIVKSLQDDVTFNDKSGKEAGEAGEKIFLMTEKILVAASLLATLFAVFMTIFIIGNVAKPLTKMTEAMEKLGKGDKGIKVPGLDRVDEIGGMAHALQVFKDTAIEADRLAGITTAEHEAKAVRQKKIDNFISVFQKEVTGAMSQLASAATEMRSTAESMSATAEETSRQSTAVAAASEQASASVSTVASAAEELSASITEISRQTEASQKTADQAVEQAKNTETTVRGLEAATSKITDVMNLINDIASQTNLLALNATIEAARAGEAGKGFAVVASEVKNLAGQTAKATEEVGAQINAMQSATKGVVDAITKIGTTIQHMSQMASDISNIVQQQSSAVHEIAHNAQQASSGTQEVSSNIVGVNRAATDTGSAAGQVLETAGDLSKQAEVLRTEIDAFLNNIQTA